MKPFALAVLILGLAVPVFAQQPTPEPEFNDVFVRLDGSSLVPLEREASSIRTSAGGFMVATAKSSSEYPGAKSPVRFQSGQPLEFVVRSSLAATSVDPTTLYVLRKLKAGKKSREAVFMSGKFTPFGSSTKMNMNSGDVPLTFTRYGIASFKVIAGALSPGEYAISRAYGQEAFCFGVD